MRFVFLMSLLVLTACAAPGEKPPAEEKKLPLVLQLSRFDRLPGWRDDSFDGVAQAFGRSCDKIEKKDPEKPFGPDARWGLNKDWQAVCGTFRTLPAGDAAALRNFIQTQFTPYAASAGTEAEGMFTGYYESSLNGSLKKHGAYQIPLHARPDDLVMVNLGEFRDELKGQRIAGRVTDGYLKPYETRADIVAGKLPPAQEKVLVWVDDAVDAFFVQVQGSGIVTLDDGTAMRIGYDGQNGHPYYAIGRDLVKRGVMEKEQVSLQTIRAWLEQNPGEAAALMNTNPSYVFFRELKNKEGPEGAQGVALTPRRSMAIDRALLPYGMPVWLDAAHPGDEAAPRLRQLMITQDTGGAIIGPVRGDFFWGYGPEAEHFAGIMKSKGQYWLLLPNNVTPR